MATQSVDWNHFWLLMSATPFFMLPSRLVRSACSRPRTRSLTSELNIFGYWIWINGILKKGNSNYDAQSIWICIPFPPRFSRRAEWVGRPWTALVPPPFQRSKRQGPTSRQLCCNPVIVMPNFSLFNYSRDMIICITLTRMISGAKYSGVPHMVHVRLSDTLLVKPKSVTWLNK